MLAELSPALSASLFTDEAINPFIITGPLGDSRSQGARWAEAVAVSAWLGTGYFGWQAGRLVGLMEVVGLLHVRAARWPVHVQLLLVGSSLISFCL